MRNRLEQAVGLGRLRRIDLHAALFLEKLAGGNDPELLLAAALAGRAVGEGHICLPLDQVAGQPVFAPEIDFKAPPLSSWRKKLLASGVAGRPEARTPLVLDAGDRLYLARYFRCETAISVDLLRRSRSLAVVDEERAGRLLALLFAKTEEEIDWQQQAAAMAVLKQFVVIAGGPGTGKTHTVARILALLQGLAGGSLRVGLAAPTGKAAARLCESLRRARTSLPPDLAAMVPDETQTLHRLLGFMPRVSRFRHDRNNPLHLDLLVLDEASMIDVPLMAAVLEALPDEAVLIMLGDRDQLTSVEAGSLFGDICGAAGSGWSPALCGKLRRLTGGAPEPAVHGDPFGDSVVMLRASYRFAAESGIGALARVVRNGATDRLMEMLTGRYDDLTLCQAAESDLQEWLAGRITAGFRECFAATDPRTALKAFDQFRILCALREGMTGVTGVNRLAEQALRAEGMITGSGPWYQGQPIMIRKNHYGLQLFNGDTGVLWPDGQGRMWAWFFRPDGTLHPVAPGRLPVHETAYAVTVHQSQGSEFTEVLLLLPDRDSRILTRELIYTGITRARKKLTLRGDHRLLGAAIERRVVRHSGLTSRLWKR